MMAPVLGEGDRVTRSLEIAFKQRNEEQKNDYLSKLIQETLLECGIKYGDMITSEFVHRLSRYIALWWTRSSFEQRLTPDQIRTALARMT